MVGYTGIDENPACQYKQEFEELMSSVEDALNGTNLTLAVTNGTYNDAKQASPIAVLYQHGYHEIPITWTNEASEISIWVSASKQFNSTNFR